MDTNPERLLRRLVLNSRCAVTARCNALRLLSNPSFSMLEKLVQDPQTPAKLVALAVERYTLKAAQRQAAAEQEQH